MEHRFFDRYSEIESVIHRLDPRTKLLLVVVFVVMVVSTPPHHLLAFVVYGGLITWASALARIPVRYLLLRAVCVLPFSVLAAMWLPFMQGGATVTLLDGRLSLSVLGLWIFVGVVMKSFLGASAMLWLISTTPFNALLGGLRKTGMPFIIVDLLALMYRYLFVLVGEAMRLRRAAAVRGYRPRWIGQAFLIGQLIGQLFLRSYERAERVHAAMVLRGFTGRMPVSQPFRFQMMDAIVLLVLLPSLVAVRIYCR